MRRLWSRLAEYRLGAPLILLVLLIYFSSTSPNFLSPYNISTSARQYSELGLVAVGMTLVIATGGIDISVGGTVGMTSMVMGLLAISLGWNVAAAAAAGLGCAALIGIINGWAIAYLGLQPVLVTLATLSLTRGIAYILTSGTSLAGYPPVFSALANGSVNVGAFPLPYPVFLTAAAFLAGWMVLRKTTFGRAVLAVGQSEGAAHLSGIHVRRTKFLCYLSLSLLAGVAGIMLTSRASTSFADAGRNYEFEAITAVVLGGTSLAGGEANMLGTLVGLATMAVLRNGMSLAGQSDFNRTQMLAAALIAAVLIDNLRRRFAGPGKG